MIDPIKSIGDKANEIKAEVTTAVHVAILEEFVKTGLARLDSLKPDDGRYKNALSVLT